MRIHIHAYFEVQIYLKYTHSYVCNNVIVDNLVISTMMNVEVNYTVQLSYV